MARTSIELAKQAKGKSLVLGDATTGSSSLLTLHTGSGSTESVVLDAKGLVSVAGYKIDPHGGIDGQPMVISGSSIIPINLPKDVAVYSSPSSPLMNTFFLLADESLVKSSGVYEIKSSRYVEEVYAYVPYESDTNLIFLDKYRIYNSAYVGKKVYYNLGDYLYPLEILGDVSTKYEDFFDNGQGFFDHTKSSIINTVLDPVNQNLLFVIDEVNSPAYSSGTTAYFYNEGLIRYKKVPSGSYDPAFDGKVIFWPMWGGMYSEYTNSGWMVMYEGTYHPVSYTKKTYNDYIVNGVFNPFIGDVRNNYNHNEFYYTRNGPENYEPRYSLNTFVTKSSFDYSKMLNTNTFLFTDKNKSLEKNTVYFENIDITGNLLLKNRPILDGVGAGENSWRASSATYAKGDYSVAGGTYNFANGMGSTAFGVQNTVDGYGGFAGGIGGKAGDGGAVFGYYNIAGYYSLATGYYTEATGECSYSGGKGVYSHYDNTNGIQIYAGPKAVGESAFNHSKVTLSGITGAVANQSAILGGLNNQVLSAATNSVVLGGSGITATQANTVYVPNLVVTGSIQSSDGTSAIPVTKGLSVSGQKDGFNKVFTFTDNVISGTAMVYINGMLQSYLTDGDYSINYGTKTITMSYPPDASDVIIVYGSCK
jgi:hypothetical protein